MSYCNCPDCRNKNCEQAAQVERLQSQLTQAKKELALANGGSELVSLLKSGLEAAEGAQVLAECYFDLQEREPTNNDNYCRLLDWMKDVRRALEKQYNALAAAEGKEIKP